MTGDTEEAILAHMVRELVPGVHVSATDRDTLDGREYRVGYSTQNSTIVSNRTLAHAQDRARYVSDLIVELVTDLQKSATRDLGLGEYMTAREEVMLNKVGNYLRSRGVAEEILLDLREEMQTGFYEQEQNHD